MSISRRAFNTGLSASAAVLGASAGCAPGKDEVMADDSAAPIEPADERSPEPDAWQAEGEEDSDAFAWGVQVGDATSTGALVSLRTTEPSLSLRVMVGDVEGWTEVESRDGLEPVDGVLQLPLDRLEPDRVYSLAFYGAPAEDGALRRSPVARFRTALSTTDSRGGWRRLVFGATSCLGGNEPWPSLSFAAAERFDFFLLLGDTVYADGAVSQEEYRAFWKAALSTQGLRDVTASTSVVATWDDHELGNNWSWDDVSQEQFDTSLAAFREALPQGQGSGGTGIWRRLSWGATADLFVLDSRGERRDGDYLSVAQMTWLKEQLLSSAARFKIILNSVPITDLWGMMRDALSADRWQGYPDQRSEILSFIRDEGVGGVLWISGDQHFGMISRVDAAGGPGDGQWEVLAGPSGSFINPVALLTEPGEQYQHLIGEWNYVRFTADPSLGTVEVVFIGDDGSELDSRVLSL